MLQVIVSLVLCSASPLAASFTPLADIPMEATDAEELKFLNQQIESLTNLKNYYTAKATRFRNRGDRLEYQGSSTNLLEARKLWKQADEYDRIADRIQMELCKLEEQKCELESSY